MSNWSESVNDVSQRKAQTKKWKDKTAGGYTILSIHGPDSVGHYATIVDTGCGEIFGLSYYEDGSCVELGEDWNPVPAEPVIEYRYAEADLDAVHTGSRAWFCEQHEADNLKLGFDSKTGKLVSAEVLK